jgi:signal peptidase I
MLRESLETLILVGAIYAFVNLSSARFVVEGDSMQPNFATGQFLIVSRAHYLLGRPARGDIVVFHYPNAENTDLIKRIIGLPGDVVRMDDGQVFINDVALQEPYIREPCEEFECPDAEWRIGANQYFVMGDNRNESRDSRVFGPIDEGYIVGQALLRYWPPEDFGVVSHFGFPDDNE